MLARIAVHLDLRDRNRELAEQNERLDAAVQQRISAERALGESLDRAVIVVGENDDVQFIATAAMKLLQRDFADWSGTALPAEVAQCLVTSAGSVLKIPRAARQLEPTRATDARDGRSRLVYLDEKLPPPSPEMLLPLGLTPREAEILFWVAQGKTSPERPSSSATRPPR